ncbi:uncharacterized protein JN550_005896 [Neoarthrinium moseri]|uniref:uncharacterized protein n=1 Tax=Neoarthrinium moseri TaxID=1658444 RepID=UPI001FDAD747|nr:uncharacterized protein JN550_005896 [Neoarthrinium moseri]KAI1869266.1 hypothetical protein JN550_005896 [Neoarthrinium moseri]
MLEWHDKSCRRLDLVDFGGGRTCLSCGATETTNAKSTVDILGRISHRTQIRLLELQPGKWDDNLIGRIETRTLPLASDYLAVSYTWADESGDATKSHSIAVNGYELPITRTCHGALRRTREVNSPVLVWIDAVCINQDDPIERSEQVYLMSDIYSAAQTVYICLGEPDDVTDALFEAAETGRLLDDPLLDEAWSMTVREGWNQLFSRRYFSRVWVLQEVALAKAAVVICGKHRVSWGKFLGFAMSAEGCSYPPVLESMGDRFSSPEMELLLLDWARPSQAADPRDKVYALLGFLPRRRIGTVHADYTLTTPELYIKLAWYLVSSYGWCAVLQRAGRNQQKLQRLPSWVPDWSSPSVGPLTGVAWCSHARNEAPQGCETERTINISGIVPSRWLQPLPSLDFFDGTPISGAPVQFKCFLSPGNAPTGSYLCLPKEWVLNKLNLRASAIDPSYLQTNHFIVSLDSTAVANSYSLRSCTPYEESRLVFIPIRVAAQLLTQRASRLRTVTSSARVDRGNFLVQVAMAGERMGTDHVNNPEFSYLVSLANRTSFRQTFAEEGIWKSLYEAGELKFTERFPEVLEDPDFILLNDAWWRLMVKCFLVDEMKVTIC